MPYVITPADRVSFARCRRQWDFAARGRQNLEPLDHPAAVGLDQAIREALDIYYFPGMWDWQRPVTLPLVRQGFERALAKQRERPASDGEDRIWPQRLADGRHLLERYFDWAPGVDRFSPVQVEAEYEVTVLDPASPQRSVVTEGGDVVRYRGQIDMLAVDGNDAYWIVRHHFVEGDWPSTETLTDDDEAVAACWAWEQFYLGMTITGTIHNEVRLAGPPPADPASAPAGPAQDPAQNVAPAGPAQDPAQNAAPGGPAQPPRRTGLHRWLPRRPAQSGEPVQPSESAQRSGSAQSAGQVPVVRQHEPSGGGRAIPQHRRMYAMARDPGRSDRIEQHTSEQFRRTWIRRDPAEVTAAWHRLAAQAAEMTSPRVTITPSPSHGKCTACAFLAPCLAMRAGRTTVPAATDSAETLLQTGYRERPAEKLAEGRLGGGAWGIGRGAAPPKFQA